MIQDILNMEGESVKRRHDLIPVSKSVLLGIDSSLIDGYWNSVTECLLVGISNRREVGRPDSEALDESMNSYRRSHNLFHFYSLWKSLWRSGE